MSSLDIIVIGAGPAGLAAAAHLRDAGLSVVVLEQGSIADAIRRWPYYLKFFSSAPNLELEGFPLIVREDKPTREEYLAYLRRFVRDKRLDVRQGHRVDTVERQPSGGFRVGGQDEAGDAFSFESEFVFVATGAYDHPRPLGVPGEDLPKVSHYFTEVHPYAFRRVAVVGGRSSAAEAALLLQRAGAEVTLIHRGPAMEGLKYWIAPDLENRIREGAIRAFFGARVEEIRPRDLTIRTAAGDLIRLPNDFVLAMTGYEPDAALLRRMGIEVDPETNTPRHDTQTLETNVPGLYVAGVITCGNISGSVFIENSRHHGALILASILAKRAAC
jgi:thioredoxin reductase (NADPH)